MISAIREEWRRTVVSDEEWVQHIDQAQPAQPGEAGGCFVRSTKLDLVAYMKPLNLADRPRAAYEKIASDLAFEVGVNVPPVVLHRRSNPPGGQPVQVALSLVRRNRHRWGEFLVIAGQGASDQFPWLPAVLRQLLSNSTSAVAFDAWLGNEDRNNHGNAVFTWDGDEPGELSFIDFANSMDFNGQWSAGNYQTFQRLGVPPDFQNCLRRSQAQEAAQRIESLDDAVVTGIVERIPDDFLSPERRPQLGQWLLFRKRGLRASVEQWYPGN